MTRFGRSFPSHTYVSAPLPPEYVAYQDTDTAVLLLTASGTDELAAEEAATANLLFTPSGVDVFAAVDADTGIVALTPSGTDQYCPHGIDADADAETLWTADAQERWAADDADARWFAYAVKLGDPCA